MFWIHRCLNGTFQINKWFGSFSTIFILKLKTKKKGCYLNEFPAKIWRLIFRDDSQVTTTSNLNGPPGSKAHTPMMIHSQPETNDFSLLFLKIECISMNETRLFVKHMFNVKLGIKNKNWNWKVLCYVKLFAKSVFFKMQNVKK